MSLSFSFNSPPLLSTAPSLFYRGFKKHVFLLSSSPSHIHHFPPLKKHVFMHLFHPSLLLAVNLSVNPPSPPRVLSLYLNISPLTIHSSILREGLKSTGTVQSGKLAGVACTTGTREWVRRKDWEERRGNQSLPLLTFATFFIPSPSISLPLPQII